MQKNPKFDDIRPYYEDEIPAAMQRIAHCEAFPLLASFVYPDESVEAVRQRVAAFKTTREFQHDTMKKANEQIIKRSISEFTCDGLHWLSKDKPYLFVSNHRDIMLDSSLLEYYFVTQGFETTEITFGANLMMTPYIIDIGKANKMFKVDRPSGNIKEFYDRSLHLSEYIRHVITEKKQSVWIAQRNGRTKNGIDATDQGIIKMFCMSDKNDKVKSLADLHIVPVSVSYEWESCDILKTLELYESQNRRYTKKPFEDLTSILTGVTQFKGRVHFEICQPVSQIDLSAFENQTNSEYHKSVAKLLDGRINNAYRLYPNNYIAHDLLYGNKKYEAEYTPQQYRAFYQRMAQLNRYDTCDIDKLKELFLSIYSNPVDNR